MKKLHLFSSLTMALAVAISTGCPAEDNGDGGGNGTSGGADDAATGVTMTAAGETNGGSGVMTAADGGDDTMGGDTMMVTGSGGATTDGADGLEPQPDGAMCTEDAGCISENCYVAGALGGICGECNEDADCEFGCSAPNPLTSAPSECTNGAIGDGCETTAVCEKGLECAVIIDVPVILTASTCSECVDDTGCTDKAAPSCQPTYNVADVSGHKECVGLGSIPNGEGCQLPDGNGDGGTGNDACLSGFCVQADLLGQLSLGVCSGCATDTDCVDGQVCAPPEIDLAQGLVAGACVDP